MNYPTYPSQAFDAVTEIHKEARDTRTEGRIKKGVLSCYTGPTEKSAAPSGKIPSGKSPSGKAPDGGFAVPTVLPVAAALFSCYTGREDA